MDIFAGCQIESKRSRREMALACFVAMVVSCPPDLLEPTNTAMIVTSSVISGLPSTILFTRGGAIRVVASAVVLQDYSSAVGEYFNSVRLPGAHVKT